LEKTEGVLLFNIDDLRKGFRAAGEPSPGNVSDTILKNVKKGHAMDAGEKKDNAKSWVLTNTGEQFVEANFGRPRA
jgi:hypothetical protein